MRSRHTAVLAVVLSALVWPGALLAQPAPAGRWEGAITIMGQKLGISVVFTAEGNGALSATIDIPLQGGRAIPLRNVRADGTRVHFELPSGQGPAIFDGEIKADQMSGSFEQASMKGTFEMKRAMPEPPLPYKQEEVRIRPGDVTLAGTLTLPQAAGPHPAVILITGSGAQDRDEGIAGFGLRHHRQEHGDDRRARRPASCASARRRAASAPPPYD